MPIECPQELTLTFGRKKLPSKRVISKINSPRLLLLFRLLTSFKNHALRLIKILLLSLMVLKGILRLLLRERSLTLRDLKKRLRRQDA
jgi:hypothetical protein